MSGMVGLSGLFFITKKYLLKYISAGVSIFILYIPHLSIFFHQLYIGGLPQYFGKPANNYIIQYIKYIFQFSIYLYLCASLLFLIGIISFLSRKEIRISKFSILSLCWFFIPFLAGFFYSVYVSPVLEFSSLLFSMPFLLFCIVGWLPDLANRWKWATIVTVCLINVLSLVYERKYYDIFYKSRFEQEVMLTNSVIKKYSLNQCIPYLQMNDEDSVPQYYIKKHNASVPYINLYYPKGKQSLIKFLDDRKDKQPYLSYGGSARSDPDLMAIFLNYYSYLVKQYNFSGGAFYILTTKEKEGRTPYIFQSANDFEQPVDYWDMPDKAFISDSIYFTGKHSYKVDSMHEFAPAFSCNLDKMISNKNNYILISVALYPLETLKDVDIVSSLESDGKEIYWSATPVSTFLEDNTCRKWMKAYHSIKLPDIDTRCPSIKVKIYIWNRGKKNFYMDYFSIGTIAANPIIYWAIEKI
jgi:hypothetical protein